jgi:hypothetical protein
MQVALRGVGILGTFKQVIAGALQAYPPAGLAFAGVCLLSEVCCSWFPVLLLMKGTLKHSYASATRCEHKCQHSEPHGS